MVCIAKNLYYSGIICSLSQAEALTPTWLALLRNHAFHSTLCGLFTRAALLLRLVNAAEDAGHLCDASSLHVGLNKVYGVLTQNGIHFPAAITAAVAGELPL